MHRCEFCRTEFIARPQVKNPRACEKCQTLRQRANEKAWHARHTHFKDHYHRIRRAQRLQRIRALVYVVIECLRVGQRLLGLAIKLEIFSDIFEQSLVELGVRQINKFCNIQKVIHSRDLSGG